jgi:alpha-methylacyl-CoA racemase
MGPLAGIRIIEFAGIGPGPFCATLLADMGAQVLRLDRITPSGLGLPTQPRFDPLARGRRSVAVDLKDPRGVAFALDLVATADGLIEGFRPGVMERLGLGPEACMARNPSLVFGRITGWGQDGPMAHEAGHDINYIALAGVLGCIGPAGGKPVPPLNLVGDYGGGGMFLAFGMLAAMMEAARSGKGQVVDAAMSEGAAYLTLPMFGWRGSGMWNAPRGENLLDGGAPWYDAYRTADGRWISIGAIEAKFYANLLDVLGLVHEALPAQHERDGWPVLRRRFEQVFASATRDEWCRRFADRDACFAPVLEADELAAHPQHAARNAFVDVGGLTQPAPAPRFSRTPAATPIPSRATGDGGAEALVHWGMTEVDIDELRRAGVIACT